MERKDANVDKMVWEGICGIRSINSGIYLKEKSLKYNAVKCGFNTKHRNAIKEVFQRRNKM